MFDYPLTGRDREYVMSRIETREYRGVFNHEKKQVIMILIG